MNFLVFKINNKSWGHLKKKTILWNSLRCFYITVFGPEPSVLQPEWLQHVFVGFRLFGQTQHSQGLGILPTQGCLLICFPVWDWMMEWEILSHTLFHCTIYSKGSDFPTCSGFTWSDLFLCSCVDNNECANDPNLCGTNGVCQNTPGSFNCDCQRGFSLDPNGQSCEGLEPAHHILGLWPWFTVLSICAALARRQPVCWFHSWSVCVEFACLGWGSSFTLNWPYK